MFLGTSWNKVVVKYKLFSFQYYHSVTKLGKELKIASPGSVCTLRMLLLSCHGYVWFKDSQRVAPWVNHTHLVFYSVFSCHMTLIFSQCILSKVRLHFYGEHSRKKVYSVCGWLGRLCICSNAIDTPIRFYSNVKCPCYSEWISDWLWTCAIIINSHQFGML